VTGDAAVDSARDLARNASVCATLRGCAVAVAAALGLSAAGCGDDVAGGITVVAPPDLAPALGGLARLAGDGRVTVETVADPTAAAADGGGYRIAVVADLDCTECYRIDAAGDRAWLVHGGDLLGAQYGVAALLEHLGFRFRSPYDTYAPWAPRFDPAAAADLGVVHSPEVRVRGLQLHTLHPIEAYWAMWEPGADHLAEADRIFSWVIANRGNFIQWVALNDILDPARHAEWQGQTQTLLEHAHALGLRVGLNIQLFGQANKQNAFDLSDDTTGTVPLADELAARLPLVIDGLPFDVYDLSFGEFFSADPDTFIAAVDQTYAALHARAPAAEIHAVVHVGADQRVMYRGEDLIYYFLVKFCDPAIIPEIHTVMFYDLYENAGGAYDHEDFSEHRAYLLQRMAAGQPVAYFPESAYWVTVDDSVPIYVPLYVRSRWLDLDRLAADPGAGGHRLDEHLIFSSGWEWGYWLGDYASLRASYQRPAAYRDLLADAFGDDLAPAVDPVVALTESEHASMIDGRLSPYLSGRDLGSQLARSLDITGPPDRITFGDLAASDPAARAAFAGDQLARLDAFAADLEARAAQIDGLDLHGPWADELRDGVDVTALRARFVVTAYQASLAQLAGDEATYQQGHDACQGLLDQAKAIVGRRRAHMHAPDPSRLVQRIGNHTLYQYGYLYNADTLCYWEREMRQLEVQDGDDARVPDCLL
jgi:hypothetical protein